MEKGVFLFLCLFLAVPRHLSCREVVFPAARLSFQLEGEWNIAGGTYSLALTHQSLPLEITFSMLTNQPGWAPGLEYSRQLLQYQYPGLDFRTVFNTGVNDLVLIFQEFIEKGESGPVRGLHALIPRNSGYARIVVKGRGQPDNTVTTLLMRMGLSLESWKTNLQLQEQGVVMRLPGHWSYSEAQWDKYRVKHWQDREQQSHLFTGALPGYLTRHSALQELLRVLSGFWPALTTEGDIRDSNFQYISVLEQDLRLDIRQSAGLRIWSGSRGLFFTLAVWPVGRYCPESLSRVLQSIRTIE